MGESERVRSRAGLPVALRLLLVLGFLIALAATGLVVFADDVKMLRLAAVLALWAALIAAFAVTRSRRDARAAVMRENEAQLAYQLELHREVAARREYEADLSRQVAAAQSDQLAELREQLDQLTGVLSSLAGGEFTVSRLTLSAESARFNPGGSAGAAAGTVLAGQNPGEIAGARTVDADAGAVVAVDGQAGWVRPEAPAAAWATRHAEWVQSADGRRHAGTVTDDRAGRDGRAQEPREAAADEPVSSRPAAGEDVLSMAEPALGVPHPREPEPDHREADEAESGDRKADRAEPGDSGADEVAPGEGGPAEFAADDRESGEAEPGGEGTDEAESGDHESGVSVADLIAAYGLSGRSRRRRRG